MVPAFDHVSLVVTDLDRSVAFYRDVLGLAETRRPPFDFSGAWFSLGAHRLHLIVNPAGTFRQRDQVDSRDGHFAVRVSRFEDALAHLALHGYREDVPEGDHRHLRVNRSRTAGYLQVYLADPDRNIIEINADGLALAPLACRSACGRCALARAFSSDVDSGSREENAKK
jgi:catechol 2,3-dioxygenase-like lactoylglutathione lyase family enzyme